MFCNPADIRIVARTPHARRVLEALAGNTQYREQRETLTAAREFAAPRVSNRRAALTASPFRFKVGPGRAFDSFSKTRRCALD
jgi:hypothetical protein